MRAVLIKQCNYLLKYRKHRYKLLLFNTHHYKLGNIVSNKNRLFSYYSYCIPKPIHIKNKNFGKITNDFGYAGEDSFFTFKLNQSPLSPLFFIGVADGVGSWKPKKAKDAANYSQQLMLSGIKYLSSKEFNINNINNNNNNNNNNSDNDDNYNNLSHLIASNSSKYVNKLMKFDGASTICIVNIMENNKSSSSIYKCQLNAFNLGDSGFSIYRYNENNNNNCYNIIYKSPAQEQGFGIPYQLGSHPTANSIDDGYCLHHFNLKSFDIIIVGSDGLWDNLFDDEISNIICLTMSRYFDQYKNNNNNNNNNNDNYLTFNNYVHSKIVKGDLTHIIIKQAYLNSIDRKKETPWSQAMTQTVDMVYNGGKQDDITCVVVFIH